MYTTYYGGDTLTQADYDALYSATAALPTGFYIWFIIAGILAIVGGVLTYFLFVKKKEAPKGKFTKWLKDFLAFILFFMTLIGGPILIRLGYEMTMMFIMIWRNTQDIAESTAKKK